MSTRAAGQNAMMHAMAWATSTYGEHAVLKAQRVSVRIPAPDHPDGYRSINKREDLFGCADMLIMREVVEGPTLLVQVTTEQAGGGVAHRRNKAELWLRRSGLHRCDFHVIAWVRRTHFRRWVWMPVSEVWIESDPFWSPGETRLIKQGGKAA